MCNICIVKFVLIFVFSFYEWVMLGTQFRLKYHLAFALRKKTKKFSVTILIICKIEPQPKIFVNLICWKTIILRNLSNDTLCMRFEIMFWKHNFNQNCKILFSKKDFKKKKSVLSICNNEYNKIFLKNIQWG